MELVKKNIHMDRIKGQAATQITLEDDVNISDMKPDAARLVYDKGSVALEEIKVTEDHVSVRGKLQFMILYLTEGDGKCSYDKVIELMKDIKGCGFENISLVTSKED